MKQRLLNQRLIPALAVLIILLITGCAPSREDQINTRLEAFKQILPTQVRTDFENEKYDAVIAQVDSLLAVDPAFKTEWEDIKSAEAINLFTTEEVINYFVKYFVNYHERP